MVFGGLLIGGAAWFIGRDIKKNGGVKLNTFWGMTAESLVYAALLGSVVSGLTSMLLNPGLSAVVAQ